ncbi:MULTISPECIES: single-stranded DNA-binding protein [Psychrilyobacter]|uniref:DUF1413 domain-containing protein n=1 Tax=Psychrilyobacter piezotolerans TaxID=2293438 RepID=A0ABX9KF43_9FUSO|nr:MULTISPECIES: single-stranded DNA-binding protein [Psychrilyobacter]MCS5421977.1 single-stranded DNA-binding protein [Psychrilyobacter sp. S5]NDI78828.1 single-stranded DNA-binding protein [Psychrilyobacter piezotolerans]RDE59431.1 DUF1413 domain-containing protein [Psychrilyobacter sp. S5]REI39901.1 DUF1413 domain-containing protein [Psychrilyobacter piezotolerans]
MEAYLEVALKEIKQLKSGENFTLQELFKNYEWESLDIMKRTTLERMFLHAVESGEAQGIIILKKNQEGQQVYQKE